MYFSLFKKIGLFCLTPDKIRHQQIIISGFNQKPPFANRFSGIQTAEYNYTRYVLSLAAFSFIVLVFFAHPRVFIILNLVLAHMRSAFKDTLFPSLPY